MNSNTTSISLGCQKIGQPREMDKFLEIHNHPRLNQEEIDNLNRLITSSEIEIVI